MKNTLLTLLLFAFFSVPFIYSQPGILDADFDADGKVTKYIGTSNAYSTGVVIQADNKIVVAGVSKSTNYDATLLRYHTDGSLDASFGEDGIVITSIEDKNIFITDIALQTDEKIVVCGYSAESGDNNFFAARYLTDGTLDNTFSVNGMVETDLGSNADYGLTLGIQSDGKILVAGRTTIGSSNYDFALVRYNTDGTLDLSFSEDGKVTTDNNDESYDYGNALTIQSDGKILIGGYTAKSGDNNFVLMRYDTEGTLDNSFSVDGKVTTSINTGADYCSDIALQQDGKIIAAGNSLVDATNDFAVVRYNTDGTLDNTFDEDGMVTTPIGTHNDIGRAVAIQSDGKILVAGISYETIYADQVLVRYNTDGSLDTTFGTEGIVISNFESFNNYTCDITIQANGRIVVAGNSYSSDHSRYQFLVARYISGITVGNLNFSSDNRSMLVYPNPVKNKVKLEYTLQLDENISVRLYDMQGKLIQNFITSTKKTAGTYTEIFHINETVPPGVYQIIISNGEGNQGIKIIVE